MIARSALFLGRLTGYLLLGVAVLTVLAVWRVVSGPVSLDLLTPYLTRALDDAVGNLRTEVGGTVLIWGGFDHPLELRLREVRLDAANGHELVRMPELAVGLSVRSLLRGRLALARLAVIRPTLHLERDLDGRLSLDFDGPAGAPADARPAPEVGPAGVEAPGPLAGILAALRQPAGQDGPLAALTQISILDAILTLEDRAAGMVWSVPAASLTAKRGDDGIRAQARIAVPTPGHPGLIELTASERLSDGAILASLKLREVDAGALTSALPALAPFAGSRLPLSGGIEAIFDGEFRPLRLRVSLAGAGPGLLAAPALGPEPVKLGGLALAATLEPSAGRFTLDQARLTLGEPALTLAASGRGENRGGTLRLTLTPPAAGGHKDQAAGGHKDQAAGGGASLEATLTPGATGSDLALTLADFEPARFAALLAPLGAAAFPLSGTLHLALDPAWTPGRLAVDLALAPGRIVPPPGQLPEPVPVAGGRLRFSAELAAGQPFAAPPERLEIESATVDLGGPTLSAEGSVTRAGERLRIRGGIKARALPAASFAKLWPAGVGKGPRGWIVQNVVAGTIDEAWIGIDGSAPLADPSDIRADTLDSGLAGSNLTINYFKTLPPIVGVSGRGTCDGRDLTIVTSGGHVLDMPVGETRLVFSKLDTPQEWLDIDAPLSGSIRSALRVLDTPPLGYARKVGIDPLRTQGSQTARLHFNFPLKHDLDIEAVQIHTSAVLHGAAAENIAGGLAVAGGELKLELDNTGMDVVGTTRLEGVPVAVQWREAFTDDADPQTRVALKGDVGDEAVAARFPALARRLGGTLGAEALLVIDKKKKTSLTGRLDLARARVALPELNWIKPPGDSGSLRFTVGLDKSRATRPFQLALDAAGLKLAGTGAWEVAAGGLSRLNLSEVKGGANDFKAEVKARPDHTLEITLTGASLDARPVLSTPGDEQEKKRQRAARQARPQEPGPRYDLTLQAARVVTGDQRDQALTGLRGKLRNDGVGWDTIELDARLAGNPAGLSVRYSPEGAKRRLSVTGEDAGALLRALDLNDTVRGGVFSLIGGGEPGIPARPVSAKLEVGEFRVVGAPLLARLLSALSVSGLLDLLGGEGLVFSQLAGDLTWSEDRLDLDDIRTSGGALGLTVAGPIDLANNSLALEGTIVPVYGINRILSLVPVLGDLLSGGKGQGLFAATYQLTGSASQPDVSVNPLAVLAPGFLRNLFFLN